ncbi:MAG: imidazolonepropionase [Caldilineaceae bacterium]
MQADLIIHNAAQLVTCASPNGPKRGAAMRDVGLIPDGALVINYGQIVAVGPSKSILANYTADEKLDATGKVVCPGFVDPHTHLVYGGDRAQEFELRIQGKSYLEILQAGGGILDTVRQTRAASLDQLVATARARLDAMLALGTTTVEAKSGYGLDLATELKQLQAVEVLDADHAIDLAPTFLGAHAVPEKYRGRVDDYVAVVIHDMLPAVMAWYGKSRFLGKGMPLFIDVFCEQNAFTVEQARQVLTVGQRMGMEVKAHVDEFNALGGVAMALDLGAVTVDHLDVTGEADIQRLAQSNTIGVILPAVNFNLGSTHFANARAMLDANAVIALSTDLNPGSAPCLSMPFVMALACRYQKLLPAEALNASTINAAHAIGLGSQIGSLEVGKQADVLLVNAPDYRHLAYQFGGNLVERVIKRGQVVV